MQLNAGPGRIDESPRGQDAPPSLQDLFASSAPFPVDPGASLFLRGELATSAFVLAEGLVKLTRSERGREIIVSLRHAGTLVGAPDALLGGHYLFSAVAVQPCVVRRVLARNLIGLTRSDPNLLWNLMQSQIVHLRDDLERVTAQGCLSLRERLARFMVQTLAHQARRAGADWTRLHLPVRRWELAQLLAVTPEHLSRTLKEMESDGLIARRRGWVFVSDMPRLRAVAQGSAEAPAATPRELAGGAAHAAQRPPMELPAILAAAGA